jgi:hypothetical protein
MRYFQASKLIVSLSDLLEGSLIDFLGEEGDSKSMMSLSPYLKTGLF